METEASVLEHAARDVALVAAFDEEGRLLQMNPEGRSLLGYGVDDARSETHLSDYYPEIVYERHLLDAYEQALVEGSWTGYIEMYTRDRRLVMTRQRLEVLRRSDGSFQSLTVTARPAGIPAQSALAAAGPKLT